MLGGLAYYEGKLYTQNSIMSHQHDYSYTFTPSRLIFPRGFLWDDGFHNSIMAAYKPDLTMDILHSWFKKVDLFGWIGREQIRGFEISSMMPDSRFIYQDVFELNPPTIVMPVL
jgi:mannosyl-oligosaccharide glucosidase